MSPSNTRPGAPETSNEQTPADDGPPDQEDGSGQFIESVIGEEDPGASEDLLDPGAGSQINVPVKHRRQASPSDRLP